MTDTATLNHDDFLERHSGKDSWQLIKGLKVRSDLSWCILCDFNDILAQLEKRGGIRHPNNLHGFRDAINLGSLKEVSMQGYPYKWERGRGTPGRIEEKLDKALATRDLFQKFQGTVV